MGESKGGSEQGKGWRSVKRKKGEKMGGGRVTKPQCADVVCSNVNLTHYTY